MWNCEKLDKWVESETKFCSFCPPVLIWKWNNYLACDFKLDLEWFCETYLWSLCVPFSCRGDHSNLAKIFSLGKIFAKWFSSCLAIFEPTFNLRSGFLLFLQLEAERRVSDWFFLSDWCCARSANSSLLLPLPENTNINKDKYKRKSEGWVIGVAPGPPIHLFSSRCQKIQI